MLRSRLAKRLTALGVGAVLAVVGLAIPVAGAAPARQSSGGKCPVNALKNAKSKPVEITYWQGGLQRANEEAILRLTDKFNSSQNDVRVTVVNQTTYADTLNKFRAGSVERRPPGPRPDRGHRPAADDRHAGSPPGAACVKADKYDLSDNLKRVVDYYSVKGKLWPMPFNVSNPILYFNKKAFESAGLDPNNPPKTLDEVKTAAQKLKDSGTVSQAGFGLKLDPWYLEQWSALGGKTYVNNGNGRKSRATSTTFDNATGKEIFTFLNDMVSQGLARTNPADGPSAVRQPARHRQRQLRHDDRHVGRARHDLSRCCPAGSIRTSSSASRPCRARRGRAACSSAEAPTTS